jgi:hypothetical protein
LNRNGGAENANAKRAAAGVNENTVKGGGSRSNAGIKNANANTSANINAAAVKANSKSANTPAKPTGGRLTLAEKGEIVLTTFGRIPIIDNARGFIMLLILFAAFVLSNIKADFADLFRYHSVFPGVTMRDLATPVLMFTIAIALNSSFRKRAAREGVKAAKRHIIMRGAVFIAFGLVFDEAFYMFFMYQSGGWTTALPVTWDIFHAMGASLIVMGLTIDLKNKYKIPLIFGLAAVPVMLSLIFPDATTNYLYSAHILTGGGGVAKWGGLLSFFSFGPLVLAYYVLTELAFKDIKKYLIVCAAIVAAAVVCFIITPTESDILALGYTKETLPSYIAEHYNPFIINFITSSVGYLIFGAAIGALATVIAVVFNYISDRDYFILAAVGRNSLLVYVFFGIFDKFIPAFIKSLGLDGGSGEFYIPIFVGTAITAAVCGLMEFLDRKKLYFRL